MPKFIASSTLRDHLADVLKELDEGEEYLVITRKTKPVSAILNIDFFEDLLAAASPEYLKSIRKARSDYRAGRVLSHEDIFGEFK